MATRSKRSEDPAEPGFEQRLEALEAIVRELEGEGLTLEQSLARYQQGAEHLAACRALLDGAEKRLVELVETSEGGARQRPLKVTEQGLAPATGEDPGDDRERR